MNNQAAFKKEIDKSLSRSERLDVSFYDELHGIDKRIATIMSAKVKAITM